VTASGAAASFHPSAVPNDGPAEEDLSPITPFPSTPIEEMLRVFVKGVRAHQLYLHNNPTYLRALENLRAAFGPIWEYTDDFALQITESELVWEQVPVLHEPGKTADCLPWLFYKDGVRELRFQKGFEQEDLVGFLDIIRRARRQAPDEDDLLVMLWERDLLYLRYKYVELAEDGGLGLGELTAHPEPRSIEPPRSGDPVRAEEQLLESRPGLVNLADFDTTLYFLDDTEVAYLRQEVESEYAGDLRQNVIGILLDIFETQDDTAVRDEIGGVLDLLIVHFLTARELRAVAYLLQETQKSTGRATNLADAQRGRLMQLPDQLSQADALSQLLESLDQSVHLPPVEDLTALFEELRPRALETVFAWLPRIQDPSVRELLQAAATRLTAANTGELVRLIGSAHPVVAMEAIRRAGAVRSPAAVTSLARRLTDPDPAMRLAAVLALAEIGSAGALQGLERAIDDADRDVRVAVARALSTRGYRPALPRFEGAVKAKTLRDADLTEKMAMFEAYAALCGDAGVPLLDGILNARGFLGKREDSEVRACAAMALGRIGTEIAMTSLRRAGTEKDIVVRSAVNKALRGVAP
jgi:HEAT repeat protein